MIKLQNTVCVIVTSSFYTLFMYWWECLCDMADPGFEEWKGRSGLHMCSCGFNCYWCSGWFICSWRIAACINYWSCSVTFGLVRLIQCTIYASEDFDLQWFHAFYLWATCWIHIKWHIHWVALYFSDWWILIAHVTYCWYMLFSSYHMYSMLNIISDSFLTFSWIEWALFRMLIHVPK